MASLRAYDEKVLINTLETDIISWGYALLHGQVKEFDLDRNEKEDKTCQ